VRVVPFSVDQSPVSHSEPVLLIDDDQAEVPEHKVFLYQGLCADDQVAPALFDFSVEVFSLAFPEHSGEKGRPESHFFREA
jgi:hypothetical protein